MSWPGQRNGQISASLMSLVLGHGMHPAAAVSFTAMRLALFAATGVWIGITEAYRPYERQERLFRDRYTSGHKSGIWWAGTYWRKKAGVPAAAVPGTSNHGWALALDINNYGSTAGRVFRWLLDHAGAYGWSWTTGRNANEPWHWEYVGSLTRPASGGVTRIGFLMALSDDKQQQVYDAVESIFAAIFNGGPSMPDAGLSLGQSVQQIRAAVAEIQRYTYFGGQQVEGTIGDPGSVFGRVITLQAQVTGLTEAVKALAIGQGIDPAAIEEAARKGAEKALEGIQLAVIKE